MKEFDVYLRRGGRISMSGLNEENVAYVARAIHAAVTTIFNEHINGGAKKYVS